MLVNLALFTVILFGTITADLEKPKAGVRNANNDHAMSKRDSMNIFSGGKRSVRDSTWANPETINFLKQYFSKIREDPAGFEERKKRTVNTVNPEMLQFLENFFVKLGNNANQAKNDRNNQNRMFNQIVKRSGIQTGREGLSEQERAIVDKFYSKLVASESFKRLLEAVGNAPRPLGMQSNIDKRSADKSLTNAMKLLADLKELDNAGGKNFMNYMKRSEDFEFKNLENDAKRSENDNEEVDYKTYLDIIKKYDKRADPMRVDSVQADMADQSSNQSFFDRFMSKLFAKPYSKRSGHMDNEDMDFLKRSDDYLKLINTLKSDKFSNDYSKFVSMLKRSDQSSETTDSVSDTLNKRFFSLFEEPKTEIMPTYESSAMKHSSYPNSYAPSNGNFIPYKPPKVTATSSTYKTVYPLFQKKWSPFSESADTHQSPFRLQKRSGGHFSPGTFDTKSPMRAILSKNFHPSRIPFVPVRIAKRNAHYSPSIGPQTRVRPTGRNYRKKSTRSKGGRDYFEARNNAPTSRAYFPLF